uniref:Methyltransferase type 11 domain-containing protein n=1 Tax=Arion vulgaris TaxID=1028688 RepID=A0A0B7BJG3_9EUPU
MGIMPYNCDYNFAKKASVLLFILVLVGAVYIVATRYNTQVREIISSPTVIKVVPESSDIKTKRFMQQRNDVSRQLNQMKQLYGQQSCEQLKLQQTSGKTVDSRVSENGGWCSDASSPESKAHMWDQGFSTALSKFLAGKEVASFGDGPGQYKKHLDSLGQVKIYTAYDGAPYCETVTKGTVKFLDLTAPQYGLPAYDWVVSVEVGEHIPAKFEDIYLDNLARHAREGLVLSWAVPGQGGLSHVNNKALVDVIAQLNKRGFEIDKTGSEPLRQASSFSWLKGNIYTYKRVDPKTFIEEDV